jgi:hypothetical protein
LWDLTAKRVFLIANNMPAAVGLVLFLGWAGGPGSQTEAEPNPM